MWWDRNGEYVSRVLTPPAVPTSPAPHAAPVPPGGHPGGVSNDDFRAAMSRLASGVVLVTAREASLDADDPQAPVGEDVGMTATAFLSVSLDPPLVMVSVREGSRMDDLLAEQPLWAVSVLSESQRHIAGRFAMKGRISDRLLFEDIPYVRGGASGAPLVGGALANLECRTEQRVEAGDHTLVIGRVLTATTPSADGGPLAYFRGRYRQLG
ncbi:flavin reductase family protein [Streptomyces sp. NPDC002680]|uniref:flavin reductase family protein n=1 Tax=Streptomyces sp. NPDC002680 TaxID=3364659 RepID=UPI0036C105E8